MKQLLIGAGAGAAVTATLCGLLIWMFSDSSSPDPLAAHNPGAKSKGSMDFVCELRLDLDGQMALGIKTEEPARITMAQVDFDKRSGWYQGRIAISESRGGTLSFVGNKLRVTRPAMFQMFGTMISQEQFTIDRSTGAFEQQLTISEGKVVTLIKGTCAQVIKPPF